MAGFQYYVPTAQEPNRQSLDEIGFPHSHVAKLPGRHVTTGPIDKPGHIFALSAPDRMTPKFGYYPDDQTWLECADGKFFIGRNNNEPPTPYDLQNKEIVPGVDVKMGDGNEWTVPTIRDHASGTPKVESVLRLRSDGVLINDAPAAQYVRMWGLVQKLYNDGNIAGAPLNETEIFCLVADVLALNYRISIWELGALSIITTHNIDKVFRAILGIE